MIVPAVTLGKKSHARHWGLRQPFLKSPQSDSNRRCADFKKRRAAPPTDHRADQLILHRSDARRAGWLESIPAAADLAASTKLIHPYTDRTTCQVVTFC